MPLTIELELVNSCGDIVVDTNMTPAGYRVTDANPANINTVVEWRIEDVSIKADVVMLDNAL